MTTPVSRRTHLAAAGSLVGLALAVAMPLAASAHVGVSPDTAPAGTRTTLQFSFSHGCEDSPTMALAVDIPDEVTTVTPVSTGEWTIARDLGADGVPTRVTFTADEPVESGLRATVALDVTFAEGSAGTSVAFPVEQRCVTGSTAWSEVADAGDEEPAHPAPLVLVSAADESDAATASDGHGDAHSDSESDTPSSTTAAESAGVDDPVARGLAAASLATGVATLVVAIWRRRARA
ncbi:DUF1775 domain-containing protein [Microbacterium sp. ET2]|uniref:DUF1775 domain-containing protein n=1 Tax=Microbacterium albipurpureum TaxID=3050384 RepID=UPI00259D208E|nr:DUF1775 domain-containing protein [Microbacterium sp. ET2 (Ac-2212)]WJL95227.1 DUF1775 domain-containing protein [Microbacterium sp. ET2 (Ac-2212)]